MGKTEYYAYDPEDFPFHADNNSLLLGSDGSINSFKAIHTVKNDDGSSKWITEIINVNDKNSVFIV